MHLISLVLLFLLLATPIQAAGTKGPSPTHHPAWLTSESEAFTQAGKKQKLVIVDAYADWCGWCKRLDRDVLDQQDFIDKARDRFVLLRLDTEDGGEGSAFAQKHQIFNLPTTVVFDHDQSVAGKIVGYRKMDSFLQELDLIEKGYRELLAREKVARQEKSADGLLAIAREWKSRGAPARVLAAASRAVEIASAPPTVRAGAAYEASAAALAQGDTTSAEQWLERLETIEPFPREMDGLPEIIRSDIASTRKDWNAAIELLRPLLARETLDAGLRAGLAQRIQQLENAQRLEQLTGSSTTQQSGNR